MLSNKYQEWREFCYKLLFVINVIQKLIRKLSGNSMKVNDFLIVLNKIT